MQVHGVIKKISDTLVVSEKFSKREFVLTLDASSQYPQHVQMEFTQDKCGLLDKYAEGQEVSVDFNLRGREWNGPQGIKYFNTIQAWKIQAVNEGGATSQAPAQDNTDNKIAPDVAADMSNNNEDLPF